MSRTTSQPATQAPHAEGALAASDAASLSFDAALAALREVVERLETGGLPLEDAVTLYERGVALHERCAALLGQAELRLRRLADVTGGGVPEDLPFTDPGERP